MSGSWRSAFELQHELSGGRDHNTETHSLNTELFQLSQSPNGGRKGGEDIVGQTKDSEVPEVAQPFREGG